MKYCKVSLLVSIILLIGCNRIDNQILNTLIESDKREVLLQIIKDEKIENLDNEFSKINPNWKNRLN
jgi:hypothetical protein